MKNKYLILILLTILIAVTSFIISGQMINKSIKKIKRIDRKIKKSQQKLNSAKILNEQLKEVSKVIENTMVTTKIVDVKEVNAFVKQLADMADSYKIPVYSIVPKSDYNKESVFVKQQYTMEINATYTQLGQFLSAIESLDKIVKITTLDVQPIKNATAVYSNSKKKGKNTTHYRVSLEFTTVKIVKEG